MCHGKLILPTLFILHAYTVNELCGQHARLIYKMRIRVKGYVARGRGKSSAPWSVRRKSSVTESMHMCFNRSQHCRCVKNPWHMLRKCSIGYACVKRAHVGDGGTSLHLY
jgi:hypothetical protein